MNLLGQVFFADDLETDGNKFEREIRLSESFANGIYLIQVENNRQPEIFKFRLER